MGRRHERRTEPHIVRLVVLMGRYRSSRGKCIICLVTYVLGYYSLQLYMKVVPMVVQEFWTFKNFFLNLLLLFIIIRMDSLWIYVCFLLFLSIYVS